VPIAIEPTNGVVINLTAPTPGVVGRVEWGYLALDGTSLIDSNSNIIRSRRKLRDDGMVAVSLAINRKGDLAGVPMVSAPGCLDEDEDGELFAELRDAVAETVAKGARGGKGKLLEDSIRNALRKVIRDELGKKPVLAVHIHQV
jgi:ribonuclease J